MREKVKTKRKSDVKEMVYVDGVSRRGKPTLSLQSVSPSPPPITPSPSKSRRSMRGSESPSKRQRIHSPQFYDFMRAILMMMVNPESEQQKYALYHS